MTAFIAWGASALIGSAVLMALVLAVRGPVRRWVGPRLGYALWALPALRLLVPPVPVDVFGVTPGMAAGTARVLFAGPRGQAAAWQAVVPPFDGRVALLAWLVGAVVVLAVLSTRHFAVCRALQADAADIGREGRVRVIAADVASPLAFGVVDRVIAVPRAFGDDYTARERDLALAHEVAHHDRGDLLANWASIVVFAVHWWNPLAWIAIRAFRDDQELAVDAQVIAAKGHGALAAYAHVLAKAAGIGALPACNLNARSNLKGRLMMLGQTRRTTRRLVIGGAALACLGGAAIAATATAAGTVTQAVTIGVKPDGAGGFALIVGNAVVPRAADLPAGIVLPADFSPAGGCDLKPAAKPSAMVIKGAGPTRTYTVMCASAAPAPIRATLAEGLTSLTTMRASVASQPASAVFPERERAHALGAIDRSIKEVRMSLAAIG